ncbi:MAG: hypothetical protein LBE92_11050 [Chryseobacterium sp.]|jgi:hypothetical protein|uniref:hypothetical protein n=1 Tax=Chryseobacterium sp. TaxID=1871047 RepID=UPI002822A8B4|nr:hypothetical protein [Chryseobacterium sp.]MDR2236652.1 hypothetical protein [Chryseobacterium sp.]
MRKAKAFSIILSALGLFLSVQCSSDNSSIDEQQPAAKDNWIVYNSTSGWGGNIYSFSDIPQGDISLADKKPFYQIAYSAGGKSFGDHIYRLGGAASSEEGFSKLNSDNTGNIVQKGFIATHNNGFEPNYLVVSETEGYYWDGSRGMLKIQTFNPGTMQRTGEIDLNSLAQTIDPSLLGPGETAYQAAGQLILIKRDNKLYLDLQIGKKGPNWQVKPIVKEVAVVVYNLTSGTVENITRYPNTTNLGLFTDHVVWSIDEVTKDIYMVAAGDMKDQEAAYSSKILRIKNGQNTFDSTFEIDIKNYVHPAEFNRLFAYNNKIYTTIPSGAVSYYGGGMHGVNYRDDVWFWHEIDTQTKQAVKLNIPVDNFYNYQNPFLYKNRIYFISNNKGDGFSGLTSYDPASKNTKMEFKLKGSGRLMGVNVLPAK